MLRAESFPRIPLRLNKISHKSGVLYQELFRTAESGHGLYNIFCFHNPMEMTSSVTPIVSYF